MAPGTWLKIVRLLMEMLTNNLKLLNIFLETAGHLKTSVILNQKCLHPFLRIPQSARESTSLPSQSKASAS